jgi:hypothetical protein
VRTPATVGIDNDLSAGKTGVSLRATNDEATTGLDVIDDVVVDVLSWNNFENKLLQLGSEVLGGDVLAVLGANDDSVDPLRDNSTAVYLIFEGDLGLCVRSQPGEFAGAASRGHGSVELMGE